MQKTSILALGFGIIATVLVITLLKSIIVLLSYKMKGDGSDLRAIITIFKLPLIALLAFILFVAFVVPALQ